ncbi:MAG: L-ribulose-5-phosphate 4-epimerase [Oscillospiraceae bacterium]|nr:L-ribulose-5-phosphate 4-epimerase [Oscillospiraceae bacterium]
MLEQLKHEVYQANIDLVKLGLVIFTWGNVSGIDRASGLFVIKPSGVQYDALTPEDMVVVDLQGNKIEGKRNPSSDTPTHCALYNAFDEIGGVAHTHSPKATAWAQAGQGVVPLGTTHADYFYGEIPCTRVLTTSEIASDYEHHTGLVIAEAFAGRNPMHVPAALVHSHGPFAWGKDVCEAVYHAKVLEEVAAMALDTRLLGGGCTMQQELLDKHFLRKHGVGAYYGQ